MSIKKKSSTTILHHYAFLGKSPALFLGLAFFLGIEFAFYPHWILLVPLSCLLLLNIKFAKTALLVAFAGFCYTYCNYCCAPIGPEGCEGIARVDLESVSFTKSRFGEGWYYKGKLLSFMPKEGIEGQGIKNIPITFRIAKKRNFHRPKADGIYDIPCRLFLVDSTHYKMKVNRKLPWEKIKSSLGIAELRYQIKQKVNTFLKSCFSKPNSQIFLAGLITGEFNDNRLKMAFSRFGLLHLMAISGFHFSLIAIIFVFLLRPLFSPQKVTLMVTLILTLYFLFLGSGPSILRAWMMTLTSFGTLLFKRPTNSRNTLGFALIITLITEPTLCNHLGFQFSFLMTAAILFGCPIMEELLLYPFPKKDREALEEFTFLEKHILCILTLFRPTIALNLVTMVAALPLSLYYFQQFPLMSFVYNLFFPFFVSISLFLLICGNLIPLINNEIHLINDYFTNFILNMTMDVPKKFDLFLRINCISTVFLILYYTLFFTILIILHGKYYKKENKLSKNYIIT